MDSRPAFKEEKERVAIPTTEEVKSRIAQLTRNYNNAEELVSASLKLTDPILSDFIGLKSALLLVIDPVMLYTWVVAFQTIQQKRLEHISF
jgi:hypothetical protein